MCHVEGAIGWPHTGEEGAGCGSPYVGGDGFYGGSLMRKVSGVCPGGEKHIGP